MNPLYFYLQRNLEYDWYWFLSHRNAIGDPSPMEHNVEVERWFALESTNLLREFVSLLFN
jgi:hypothetical protein